MDKMKFNRLQMQKRIIKEILTTDFPCLSCRIRFNLKLKALDKRIKMELDKSCGVVV